MQRAVLVIGDIEISLASLEVKFKKLLLLGYFLTILGYGYIGTNTLSR